MLLEKGCEITKKVTTHRTGIVMVLARLPVTSD